MNITRNTLCADGLTVGEKLDKDALFLRSIIFDIKDGPLDFNESQDAFREKCRQAVLDALDKMAEGMTDEYHNGPKDNELEKLFAGIDPIADRIFKKRLDLC